MSQLLKLVADGDAAEGEIDIYDLGCVNAGYEVAVIPDNDLTTDARADNARRIVACVNACYGIDIGTLERAISIGGVTIVTQPAFDEIVRRARQRDELLAALDELANGYSGNGWDVGLVPRLTKARALVAKAKGGAA